MTIIERVRALHIPASEMVVIGSGVLDALRLRTSGDVDLVLSPQQFDLLRADDSWQIGDKNGEPIAQKADTEAFLSWGSDGVPNFRELYDGGITVDGIRFAHPQFVIGWKRGRALDKDLRDIALLEEYLKNHDV